MNILKKAFALTAAAVACPGLSACGLSNDVSDVPDIVGDDWRVTGIVRDGGTITRDGADTDVPVCVHTNDSAFYYDTSRNLYNEF